MPSAENFYDWSLLGKGIVVSISDDRKRSIKLQVRLKAVYIRRFKRVTVLISFDSYMSNEYLSARYLYLSGVGPVKA